MARGSLEVVSRVPLWSVCGHKRSKPTFKDILNHMLTFTTSLPFFFSIRLERVRCYNINVFYEIKSYFNTETCGI